MEDAVEDLGAKGQATRFSLEEARRPAPFLQFLAALVEHSPGKIETVEINVLRKIADVCAGADSDFEHARTWLDLKLGYDLAAKIELRLDQAVKGLGQVVTGGERSYKDWYFKFNPVNVLTNKGIPSRYRIDAASRGITETTPFQLELVAGVWSQSKDRTSLSISSFHMGENYKGESQPNLYTSGAAKFARIERKSRNILRCYNRIGIAPSY